MATDWNKIKGCAFTKVRGDWFLSAPEALHLKAGAVVDVPCKSLRGKLKRVKLVRYSGPHQLRRDAELWLVEEVDATMVGKPEAKPEAKPEVAPALSSMDSMAPSMARIAARMGEAMAPAQSVAVAEAEAEPGLGWTDRDHETAFTRIGAAVHALLATSARDRIAPVLRRALDELDELAQALEREALEREAQEREAREAQAQAPAKATDCLGCQMSAMVGGTCPTHGGSEPGPRGEWR